MSMYLSPLPSGSSMAALSRSSPPHSARPRLRTPPRPRLYQQDGDGFRSLPSIRLLTRPYEHSSDGALTRQEAEEAVHHAGLDVVDVCAGVEMRMADLGLEGRGRGRGCGHRAEEDYPRAFARRSKGGGGQAAERGGAQSRSPYAYSASSCVAGPMEEQYGQLDEGGGGRMSIGMHEPSLQETIRRWALLRVLERSRAADRGKEPIWPSPLPTAR